MALWDDLKLAVYTWTNRTDRIAETELALKNGIRTAHKQGKFWRDTVKVSATPTGDTIQTIDLVTYCPRMRQLAYVKYPDEDTYLVEADIGGLVDGEGYAKQNIYWGIGSELMVRSAVVQATYEIVYYRQPVTTPPESISDWLLEDYQDVVVLFAAATVLGIIGEQEIKNTVNALLAINVADMISDQLEVTGR